MRYWLQSLQGGSVRLGSERPPHQDRWDHEEPCGHRGQGERRLERARRRRPRKA